MLVKQEIVIWCDDAVSPSAWSSFMKLSFVSIFLSISSKIFATFDEDMQDVSSYQIYQNDAIFYVIF